MQFPLVELVLFFLLFRVPLFNDVAFISFFFFRFSFCWLFWMDREMFWTAFKLMIKTFSFYLAVLSVFLLG